MHQTATPSLLRRLGRFCYRRHWLVLICWVVAIFVLNGIAGGVGNGFSDSFGDFESEATDGFELLEEGFGTEGSENQGSIVFVAPGDVTDPAVQGPIEELLAAVDEVEGLEVISPYDNPEKQIASQGELADRLAYATVIFPIDLDFSDSVTFRDAVLELTGPVEDAGVRVELGGMVFAEFEPPESEVLGMGFAIVILILAFGSVVAMGVPIGMALAGIGAGIAVVGIVSNVVPMPEFTTTIGIMLGLGVGIDYALFIVTRFREDIHKGMAPLDSAGHALDTAGRAVLFAGTTVVISVLGMLVMGLSFIRGIGIGAAITVVFTLAASITLLPALLGVVGDKLEITRRRGLIAAGIVALALVGAGLGHPAAFAGVILAVLVVIVGLFLPWLKKPLAPRKQPPVRETFWYRYSRFVQHHSWATAIGGFAMLAILAIPVFGIRLGFSDEGNYPAETDTRQAYDLLSEGFGPGFNGPLFLVGRLPDGADPSRLTGITEAVAATEGVVLVEGPQPSEDGSIVRWFVVPETGPQTEETEALVRTLRDDVLDQAQAGTGVEVLVTSFTAMGVDFSDYLGSRYPLFFAVILGLSFLLLMAVFRSLLVPLKAVLVNLLAMGAAYGVVVAVFQWGWGASLLGIAGGAPIEPFIPMMLFAIVFGLSMDYEVFLLSRMKEEYDRTGDNANAVADGLAVTARVITAAALIMVVVFGSFLLESDRVVKLMGTGLAVAVLIDATIVRMLLVPATMELLGDRNWWLPKWLDRLLPVIHVEGGPEQLAVIDEGDGGDDGDEPERELVTVGAE